MAKCANPQLGFTANNKAYRPAFLDRLLTNQLTWVICFAAATSHFFRVNVGTTVKSEDNQHRAGGLRSVACRCQLTFPFPMTVRS